MIRFYNFGVSKKDDQYGYYSSSGALKPGDFDKFIEITEQRICGITKHMAEGRIEVSPYRLNKETPCRWCEYRSVCRFDWQINDYRELKTVSKLDVLRFAGSDDG